MKKTLKTIIVSVVVMLTAFSVFVSCSSKSSSRLENIKKEGKLVVGTEAQYAPYEFKDLNAEFVGCDIFLAQQIADALGVELEIVDMSFDAIIPAVQSGIVDLGIAAFTNTPERAEVIDFSDIYEISPQMLVVAKGKQNTYATKASLKGKKIGSQKGTVQSLLVKKVFPESELFELAKYPELAIEVKNGNIAGLVVDGVVGDSLIAANDGALVSSNYKFDPKEASFGKSVVIQKGNEDLVKEINKVVEKVLADGSYLKAKDEAIKLQKKMGL